MPKNKKHSFENLYELYSENVKYPLFAKTEESLARSARRDGDHIEAQRQYARAADDYRRARDYEKADNATRQARHEEKIVGRDDSGPEADSCCVIM